MNEATSQEKELAELVIDLTAYGIPFADSREERDSSATFIHHKEGRHYADPEGNFTFLHFIETVKHSGHLKPFSSTRTRYFEIVLGEEDLVYRTHLALNGTDGSASARPDLGSLVRDLFKPGPWVEDVRKLSNYGVNKAENN